MDLLKDVLFSADFLKITVPAGGAIIAWYANQRSNAKLEQLRRKEERYQELLRCIKGFYANQHDRTLKNQFIDQARLCWLYTPDEVIRKSNAFFEALGVNSQMTENDKERTVAALFLAIRRDMLSRRLVAKTSLTESDWKSFNST